jgi:hypothetical protein
VIRAHVAVLLLAAGCATEAPRILSLNGVPTEKDDRWGNRSGEVQGEVGVPVPLVVEVVDPQGDPVRVWSAGAPPGWKLDPDTLEGTWTPLPDRWQTRSVVLLAQDVPAHGPSSWSRCEVFLLPIEDTGAP